MYLSTKATNEEMKGRLNARNAEFAEWRKGIATNLYAGWNDQKHIDYEVGKVVARQESLAA